MDIIKVKVGDKFYDTVLINDVQRFVENPDHFLVKQLKENGGQFDLNDMAIQFQSGKFSQVDYAEMNMAIGYSVSGFCDLHNFHDMKIINPLWDDDLDDEFVGMNDTYLYAQLTNKKLKLGEIFDIMMKRDNISLEEAHEKFVDEMI